MSSTFGDVVGRLVAQRLVQQTLGHILIALCLLFCFDFFPICRTLKVAKSLSSQWENDERYPSMQPQTQPPHLQPPPQPPRRLKIGYLSHDFNDHPTAHMVEGLFVHHDQSNFETYAYSYGKDDHSIFRQR